MKIAGFKKQSLIDYPGNISSVIFTQGCNFRCEFCHNPELVLPEKFNAVIDNQVVFDYLKKYSKLLTAVCITGGEPTMHKDLPDFIGKIKKLNLKVKLDTNGTNPQMLMSLVSNNLIDAVAMDIKHLLNVEHYNKATGNTITVNVFDNILSSIQIIENAGIEHELRTTVIKGLHSIEQLQELKHRFGENYKINNYNPEITLKNNPDYIPFTQEELNILIP
jgi:pyruvate formate lyase activating enzyme